MLKIGVFSKLSRISIRMLRHYDAMGLLIPEAVDKESGYRYYSAVQLSTAARIRALQEMGFSLSAVRELLPVYEDPERLKEHLTVQLAQVQEEGKRLQEQITRISAAIRNMESEDYHMKYEVTVKELPGRNVASVRGIIPLYNREVDLWHILQKEMEGRKIEQALPCYPIAIYHDEGFKESDVDVEVQINVKELHSDSESVKYKAVEPILYASTILRGSFEHITEANQAVADWISANHYEINGTMFDIGHVNPGTDPRPENWVTEICLPVRKLDEVSAG